MSKEGKGNLVWVDMEMSGLDPERDVVLEVATLVTDCNLNVLAEGPDLVVKQPPELFDRMDTWCREHHTKSGLWQSVLDSTLSLADVEKQTLEFIKKYVGERESPLCGNSVWQDRRFVCRHMPHFDRWLHYRLIDVSTIKELVHRWYPGVKFREKIKAHRAMSDIHESLAELKFYREQVFRNDRPT